MDRGRHISKALINEYGADLDRLRAVSGSSRQSVLREAFTDLLKRGGGTHDLLFVPKHDITTPQNKIYNTKAADRLAVVYVRRKATKIDLGDPA